MLNLLLKLKSYWHLGLVAALLLAAFYGQHLYYAAALAKKEAIIAQATKETAICNATLTMQNSAIERWEAAGRAQQEQQERMDKEAARHAAEQEKHVSYIQQMSIPADCQAAIKTGIDYSLSH